MKNKSEKFGPLNFKILYYTQMKDNCDGSKARQQKFSNEVPLTPLKIKYYSQMNDIGENSRNMK